MPSPLETMHPVIAPLAAACSSLSRRKVTDWREAARGIPVWEGAAAWFEGKRWRVTRLWPSVDGGEDRVSLDALDGSGDGEIPPIRHVVPDLEDPDLRAAYDRRLALALGAPEKAEWYRIRVRESYGRVIIDADTATWTAWVDVGECGAGAPDPLLARALAWPADKRITVDAS